MGTLVRCHDAMAICTNMNATWVKQVLPLTPSSLWRSRSVSVLLCVSLKHQCPPSVPCCLLPGALLILIRERFARKQRFGWQKKERMSLKGVGKHRVCVRDAYHYEARLGDSQRSHVLLLSPLDDLAPLCLRWEKGNGRRIYCWVLTCTHSWCCFSPLGPLAIPKASKTTGCQVVTAGFKQLLQQPCT